MQNNKDFSYAIVTPCFNEEKNIGIVLNSVVTQTILPKKWIIVDDESTDRSSVIINEFSKRYDWIEYCYNQKIKGKSYYCNNVYAILKGLEQLKNTAYNYLAILDADIELCPDYYERIAAKFQKNPPLGIASGTYLEIENGHGLKRELIVAQPRRQFKFLDVNAMRSAAVTCRLNLVAKTLEWR